jgi:K+-sensing histidine kinase KdpD
MDEVDWSEEKRQNFLHMIEEESENMQSMLEDILDSSLIDADQFIIEKQPVRLHHLAAISPRSSCTNSHRIACFRNPDPGS